MSSKFKNLTADKGYTFSLHVTYTDPNDVPYDLTGTTVNLIVKRQDTVVGTYPADVDAQGNIDIKVADEVTATWPTSPLEYDLEHEALNGDRTRIMRGGLTVTA